MRLKRVSRVRRINNSKRTQLNKGFTLVELIVSIAIFAIVAAAIIAFFRVAMTQYRTNTNEVNIQTESQMTWKRLESNILMTTSGVWLWPSNTTDTTEYDNSSEIYLYNYDESEKAEHKKTMTKIYYPTDTTKHVVYYQDYYLDENNSPVPISTEPQVFANLVTKFELRMYDKDGNVMKSTDGGNRLYKIEAHIEYDANGREYTSDNTVAIRNTIVASGNAEEIYASATGN